MTRIFALADPHLSGAVPDKGMEKFGGHWRDHAARIASAWREAVRDEDLVLVAGDISWALRLPDALPDLHFLAALPGTKVMVKGNHDHWWSSRNKVRAALPSKMIALQHDAVVVGKTVICGTRLWDVPGVSFDHLIDWRTDEVFDPDTLPPVLDSDRQVVSDEQAAKTDSPKVFLRELERLKAALRDAVELRQRSGAELTIAMTHYPPCDAELRENELTRMFEQAGVRHVVFGHLHSLKVGVRPFGELRGVRYHLTACDYLDFKPICLAEVDDG